MKYLTSVKWVLFALGLALFFRVFLISVFKVPNETMAPNILPGDFILSYQLSYGLKFPWMQEGYLRSLPKRGDVIVLKIKNKPGTYFVKRIIAIPGDTVEIKNSELVLNGSICQYTKTVNTMIDLNHFQQLEEVCNDSKKRQILKALQAEQVGKDTALLKLEKDHFFVLGDNRDASEDSRDWGPVHLDQITSKVGFIWLSLGTTQDSISKEKGFRFSRFLTSVE